MNRFLLLIISVFTFSSLSAQYYKDQDYFIGGSVGYQNPIGDFGDLAKGGPCFRISGRKMLNKKLSVGAEVSFSFLGQDKFWDGSHLGSYDVNYNIGSALLRSSYYFDAWDRDFRPYVSLAFGYFYYRNEIDFTAASSGTSNDRRTITENKVGLSPNIGFLYHISNTWSFNMNLRYTYIPDFPDSVTAKDVNGEEYQYFLGFNRISLPELSIGFYYRF